jgi:hypothetical protein
MGTAVAASTCSLLGASGSACWSSGSGESSTITSALPAGSSALGCPGESSGASGANSSSGATAAVDLLKTTAQHFYCDFIAWPRAGSRVSLTLGIGSSLVFSTPALRVSSPLYSWPVVQACKSMRLEALAWRWPRHPLMVTGSLQSRARVAPMQGPPRQSLRPRHGTVPVSPHRLCGSGL